MDGFGEPENSGRQPWTLEMMIENREKWSLAADVGVLEYLQKFSNDLLSETESTLQLLDTFEADLNTSCVQVSNVTNKFLSLADSQFVENRVNEEEESKTVESASVSTANTKPKQEEEKEIADRFKGSINYGLEVLKTKFETVEVTNSDSEDDDDSGPTGVVYKPVNPFNTRPLPHLIGSVEFMKDPTVGLEDPPSDEEEESLGESLSTESKKVSEDNEDSEPESDRPNSLPHTSGIGNDDITDILYKQPISTSFADHLAKRLEDMDNERKLPPELQKPTRSLFSTTPPPLDDSGDDEFGSSEELIFGNRNSRKPFDDDLFVPKPNASLWDDNHDQDFPNTADGSSNAKIDDVSERRKNAMSDFERELSKNLQKRKTHDSDLYHDILSPSPPPLDEQVSDSYDDTGRFTDDIFTKRNNPSSSLFDDGDYGNTSSIFTPDEPKDLPSTVNEQITDDLFSSTSKPAQTSVSNNPKKKLPAGAVNIFPVNILKDKNVLTNPKSDPFNSQNDESNVRKDLHNSEITKSISSLRKRNYDSDDDFTNSNENIDTEDVNNSIFKSIDQHNKSKSSSRSSSVKMSDSFQDDNLSIKSNKSAGLFDDVVSNVSKKNAIKKNMDDLFSDLNDQNADGSDEDDLFGNYVKTDNKKSKDYGNLSAIKSDPSALKKVNVIDDLFGDVDNEDLFSKLNVSKISEPKNKTVEINKNLDVNKTINKKDSKSAPSFSNKPLSLFHDDDEDFDSGSIFSSAKSKKPINKSNEIRQPASKPTISNNTKKTVSSLFDDDDDDSDLFGSEIKKNDQVSSNLFGSHNDTKNSKSQKDYSTKENSSKVPVSSIFANDEPDNDMFPENKSNPSKLDGVHSNSIPTNEDVSEGKVREQKISSQGSSSGNQKEQMASSIITSSKSNIKTADIKQISLFSDEENDESTDLLFASTVKNKGVKDKQVDVKPIITDDSPLFSDNTNDNRLFNDSSLQTTKVINTENHKSTTDENKKESEIKHDMPNQKDPNEASKEFSNDLFSSSELNVDIITKVADSKSTKIKSKSESENEDLFKQRHTNHESGDLSSNTNAVPPINENPNILTSVDVISNDLNNENNPLPSVINSSSKDVDEDTLYTSKDSKNRSNDHNNEDIEENSSLFNDEKPLVNSPESLFDADKSLPNLPASSTVLKKPEVAVKPKPVKPVPPNSLNIRSPITLMDNNFSFNDNKVASIKKLLDVPDGSVFSSEKPTSSDKSSASPRPVPGKLNLTLNIDPKALLPGARPANFKKSSSPPESKDISVPRASPKSDGTVKTSFPSDSDEPRTNKDLSSSDTSSVQNSEPVLHSIVKDRAKIPVKRRPQTRSARREAARKSMIDNVDGDETDNSSSITTTHSGKEKSVTGSLFDQPSNILSPSTDEDDLFCVPPLDLPADYTKVSTSPGDIFDTHNPTIISPNFSTVNTNIATKPNAFFADVTDLKKESSVDIFKSNENNDLVKKSSPKIADDLFSDKRPTSEITPDLFDNVKSLDDEDLFAKVKISSNAASDLFQTEKHSEKSETSKLKPSADQIDSLFSNSTVVGGDNILFSDKTSTEENNSIQKDFAIPKENHDDLFSDAKTFVAQTNESNVVINKDIGHKGTNVQKNTDNHNLFTDMDDADLFSSSSDSNKIISENESKLSETKPSPNIICDVFNTGVVNICDKLSITPPKDEDLFPAADWTASSNNNEENKTITSVPEKINTNPLFDDNHDDGDLFSRTPSSSVSKQATKTVTNPDIKKKDVVKTVNKVTAASNLFSNDDDDDALFGEVKTVSIKESVADSRTLKQGDNLTKTSPKLKSSLFDNEDNDDDPDDIFAVPSNKFKNASVNNLSNATKKSLENIFDSGAALEESKKPGATAGTVKKPNVTSSTKTPESSRKEDFVDPLSAFTDTD